MNYEETKQAIENGELKAPKVYQGESEIKFTEYQLAVHKFNLQIMASGMQMKGLKLKDLKAYYDLKGKSAKDCYNEFLLKFNL
jgi:hypothetical protein